jgi:hypothetical protein
MACAFAWIANSVGVASAMMIVARHLANRAPSCAYSASG